MKKIALCLIAVLVVASLGVSIVAAQGTINSKAPGTWTSSLNIQNTGAGAATVAITFFDSNGNAALTFDASPAIPAGGQRTYYVSGAISALPVGQYSAVVSSNESVQVVANASSTGPITYGAYSGIEAAQVSTTLNFPGLYKSYYNFQSQVVLQNVESTAANVTLTFYGQKTGTLAATVGPVSIPANASRVFALQDLASVPSGNTNGLLSLRVTSDRQLAGIANVWSPAGFGQFSDYNGYTAGSTSTIYAPALYKGYYNFNSALTVQNLSTTQSANIKVTYSNGVTATATLGIGQAIEYYQPNNAALPSGNSAGVFSAKVETLNGAPIVGLVTVNDGKTLASYNVASVASAAGSNCAMVNKAYFGGFTAETVQNVGTQATNITLTYSSGQTRVFNNVPPNGTINAIELPNAGSTLPDNSSVAAVITSSGQPIVTVVQGNRVSPQNGDTLLAYTCAPK